MSRAVMIVVLVLIGGVGVGGLLVYQGADEVNVEVSMVDDALSEAPALASFERVAGTVSSVEPTTIDDVIPGYSTMSDKEQGQALRAAIKAMENEGIYTGNAYAILREERRERFHNADEIEYGGNGYVPKGWVTN